MDMMELRRMVMAMAASAPVLAASNIVIGTFNFGSSEQGKVKTIDLPYTGTGYPIALAIINEDGACGADDTSGNFNSLIKRFASSYYFGTKIYWTGDLATPVSGSGNSNTRAFRINEYHKNSSSDATVYTSGNGTYDMFFQNPSAGATSLATFPQKNKLAVKMWASGANGFADGIDYHYIIMFSE